MPRLRRASQPANPATSRPKAYAFTPQEIPEGTLPEMNENANADSKGEGIDKRIDERKPGTEEIIKRISVAISKSILIKDETPPPVHASPSGGPFLNGRDRGH